jgi:hypothetical protein
MWIVFLYIYLFRLCDFHVCKLISLRVGTGATSLDKVGGETFRFIWWALPIWFCFQCNGVHDRVCEALAISELSYAFLSALCFSLCNDVTLAALSSLSWLTWNRVPYSLILEEFLCSYHGWFVHIGLTLILLNFMGNVAKISPRYGHSAWHALSLRNFQYCNGAKKFYWSSFSRTLSK